MISNLFALYALDVARERSLESDRRARLLRGAGPLPRTVRRGVLNRLAARASTVVHRAAVDARLAFRGGSSA